jgi:hypothetical protein
MIFQLLLASLQSTILEQPLAQVQLAGNLLASASQVAEILVVAVAVVCTPVLVMMPMVVVVDRA